MPSSSLSGKVAIVGVDESDRIGVVPDKSMLQLHAEGARNALKNLEAVKPYDPGRPAEIAVEFMTPSEVSKYAGRRGVEVTGPESIVSRAGDWWTAWRQLFLEPRLPS